MSNKSEKSFLGDVKDSLTKPFRPKKEKVKKAAPEQRREANGASGDVTCEGPSTSKQGHHAHDIQGENSLPPPDPQLAALAENNSLVQTARDELLLRENPLPSQDLQLEVLSGNNSLIEPAPGEVSQGEDPLPPQDPQLAALPGNNNVNEPAAPNEIHPAENLVPSERELNVIAEQGPGIFNSLGQKDGEHLDEQSDSLSAVSGPNEDAHQPRNGDQPDIRPNLLTQNSCYEQPSEFRDEEDAPNYGVKETASPKRTTPPVTAQTKDLSVLKEGLPTAGTGTSSISSLPAKLEHFKPDSLVKDKIVCKVQITDVLSLHLDRSVCPGRREVPLMQRWEHLADVLEVPDEIKRQCENFTGKLSPSECMFEHLCLTNDSLSIEVLKYQLGEIKRKDVADELNNNSSLSADEATVTDLCNDHPETLNAVCLKLDDMRGPINWYHLGMKLGIPGGTLRTFRDPSGCSPSEVILQKIASLHPNLSITIIADAVEKEVPAVVKVLNELPAGSTIKTLLNNLDVLDKVTALLDLQESSWMHFGAKFKIDRKVLDSLKPDPIRSPTKVLMECLVQNDPDLTMATFLKSLEKIERYDVIEELTKFFYREDIDAIFRG